MYCPKCGTQNDDNAFRCVKCNEIIQPVPQTPQPRPQPDPTQAYKVIADVAVGPNVRLKDNVFQAIFVLASVLIGAAVGSAFGDVGGAIAGALGGLIGGVLLSGVILMVYRLFKH